MSEAYDVSKRPVVMPDSLPSVALQALPEPFDPMGESCSIE